MLTDQFQQANLHLWSLKVILNANCLSLRDMSRHPTPPVQTPSPKKTRLRQQESSYSSFIPAHPLSLRGGRVSLFIALPLSDGAPVCQQSECGAERSAASRTGRQCVSDTERISTPDFRHSRGGWTERRGEQGALKARDLMWITDPIRGYVLLLLSGSWFVRRNTRGRLID